MKTKMMFFTACLLFAVSMQAQESTPPDRPMIVQTMYLNPGNEAMEVNRDSLLTVYKKNILDPNSHIKSSKVLAHWWGKDNRQVLILFELSNFSDIVKTFDKQQEIMDEYLKQNPGFLEQWKVLMSKSYHGDEIYRVISD